MNAYDIRPQFVAAEKALVSLPDETRLEKQKTNSFIHDYILAKKAMQLGDPRRMEILMDKLKYERSGNIAAGAARAYIRISSIFKSFTEGGRAIAKIVRLFFTALKAVAMLKSAVSIAQKVKLNGFLKVAQDWISKLRINHVPGIGKVVAAATVVIYAAFDRDLNMAIRNFFNTIASAMIGYPILSTKQWTEVEAAKKLVAQAKSAAELATHPKRMTGTALEQKILQHGEADLDYKEKSEKLNEWTRKMQQKAQAIIGDIIFRRDRDQIAPETMQYLKSIYHGQADWWSHKGTFYYYVSDQMNRDEYFWKGHKRNALLKAFNNLGDIAAEIHELCELLGE